MLILPLIILKGIKQKTAFTCLTVLFFVIFILPGLNNLNYFFNWIYELTIKSGKYGKGDATIYNSAQFYKNIYLIFKKDPVFGIAFITIIVSYLFQLKVKANAGTFENKLKAVSLSLSMIFIIQVIIVAKHYSQYYMIPSFMLSVPAIVISTMVLINKDSKSKEKKKYEFTFGIIFSLILIWSIYLIISSYFEGDAQRKDAEKMVNLIEEKRQDGIFISSFGSSGRETALAFASQYGAGQSRRYMQFLSERFRSKIFYNQWTDKMFTITNSYDIKNALLKSPFILVQLSHYGSIENFMKTLKLICGTKKIRYEKVYSNQKLETLYKIVIERSAE